MRKLSAAILAALVVVAGAIAILPASATPTGGSGGSLTDATSVSYTDSNGVQGYYHLYAANLDWTKEVGLLVYTDGSAEYGLDNPTSTYLIAGSTGLHAVAQEHNMILLTPKAPGNGCTDGDGDCWYLPSNDGTTVSQKITWSKNLVTYIEGRYNIEKERVAMGGYSSGAQWLTEYFVPSWGTTVQQDGVNVAISYGGQPINTPNFTTAYKAAVPMVWDVGSLDPAYQGSGQYDAQSGYDWYKLSGTGGFTTTELNVVAGEDHSRSGQFGAIMDREITQHVRAAGSTSPPTTTTPPAPAAWDTVITPARTTATAAVNDVPSGTSRVTFRMSASPFGTQTGFYQYCTSCTGDVNLTLSPASLTPGTLYYWQIESGTTTPRTVKASGTFTTLP